MERLSDVGANQQRRAGESHEGRPRGRNQNRTGISAYVLLRSAPYASPGVTRICRLRNSNKNA